MKARALVRTAILLLIFVLCSYRGESANAVRNGIGQAQSQADQLTQAIYDPDPNHIWNRLFRLLTIRYARPGVSTTQRLLQR